MIIIGAIFGLSFGLEYFDEEDIGFGINLDLGVIRFTWFRNGIAIDEEE